jgi:hypothetical protein
VVGIVVQIKLSECAQPLVADPHLVSELYDATNLHLKESNIGDVLDTSAQSESGVGGQDKLVDLAADKGRDGNSSSCIHR